MIEDQSHECCVGVVVAVVWLQQSTVAVVAALFSVSMGVFVCVFVCESCSD